MENNLDLFYNHTFEFDKKTMEKVLLIKHNQKEYKNPLSEVRVHKIHSTLASIIGIEEIKLDKVTTFREDNIKTHSENIVEIYNNNISIIYDMEYFPNQEGNTDVEINIQILNLNMLPSFMLMLIQPIAESVVYYSFMKERTLEQKIYEKFIRKD